MSAPRPLPLPWLLLAFLVLLAFLAWLLAPILTPFLLAGIIAYICNPLVLRLTRRRVPRALAVSLVMLFVVAIGVALVLILVPVFRAELARLMELLPGVVDRLRDQGGPWLQEHFGIEAQLTLSQIRELLVPHLKSAGGTAARLLGQLGSGGLVVFEIIANVLLVPMLVFYLLLDWQLIVRHLDDLIPRPWHARTRGAAAEVDRVLAEFLRGQLSVMLFMAVFYSVGLAVAGLDFAVAIGIVAGLLIFVPYLGTVLGVLLATLVGIMQFPDWTGLLGVWAVFLLGQFVESFFVTPRLVGDRIGLHPVAVVFALMAFGQVFGFFGVLLALPASAVILVGLRHVRRHYRESHLYTGN